MSLRSNYKTDRKLEAEGKWIKIGFNADLKKDIRIKLARAGGANPAHTKAMEEFYEPVQADLAAGKLSQEQQQEISRKIFVKADLKDWEGVTKYDLTGKEEDRLTEIKYTQADALALFEEMPDLFDNWESRSLRMATFLESAKEEAAKN